MSKQLLSWEFYFARNRKSLDDFLWEVETVENAKQKLFKKGLTHPPDDLILSIIEKNKVKFLEELRIKEEALKPKPKKTTPRSRKEKRQDDKKTETKKKSDEKYFRKVIPKKKS